MLELLAVCAMLAAVVVFLAQPLRAPRGAGTDGALAALETARDAKLREINDLELDRQTGKLSASDHAAVDARLRAEALELLRRIDAERESRA